MVFKLVALSALLAVAYAAPQLGGGLGGSGGLGGYNHYSHHVPVIVHKKVELVSHHEEEPHDHHAAYKFHYKVEDKKHGDYHGQEEHRDGHNVEGKYWLVEPDGHLRTVKYRADKKNGFIAEVHREYLHHH